MSDSIQLRPARPADVAVLFSLIKELARYERAADSVTGNERLLEDALFGPEPSAECVVAELRGDVVGFAMFYSTFSTWECRPGIWLEDLYVPAEHRRRGVGVALLSHLARLALDRGCARLEWAALDWNSPALDFYEKLGAERLQEWEMHRLEGAALELVARARAGE